MNINLLDRNNNTSILIAGIISVIIGLGVTRFVFTSLLPPMLDGFLTVSFAGILASLNYVGYLAGSIFSMFIKDINQKVILFRIGIFLCIVTTIVLGISQNETVWLIARIIAGFAAAMAFVVGSAIVMTKLNLPKGRRIFESSLAECINKGEIIRRIQFHCHYILHWSHHNMPHHFLILCHHLVSIPQLLLHIHPHTRTLPCVNCLIPKIWHHQPLMLVPYNCRLKR